MAKTTTRTMTAQHKAALAEGRTEGRAVKTYLEALQQNRAPAGPAPHARVRSPSASPPSTPPTPTVRALQQLQLVQERIDLQNELEAMGTKVDLPALEGAVREDRGEVRRAQGHLLRRVA